jgi:hypothetical protein
MNNLDMPAMAIESYTVLGRHPLGFTKREQACLTMGVADTGDAEFDAIITKGNRQNFLKDLVIHEWKLQEVEYAEILLQQLEGDV